MKRRYLLALSATGFAASLSSADFAKCASRELNEGWFVIVASFPTEPSSRMFEDRSRTEARAARCHVKTFNDISAKFEGFTSGYNVFVIGAFSSHVEADRRLAEVRPCFPDAYLKNGRYYGE